MLTVGLVSFPTARANDHRRHQRTDASLQYDSTMICLKYLYPLVAERGIIIIDDYHAWDGCAHAVHEFLAHLPDHDDRPRLQQCDDDIIFPSKKSELTGGTAGEPPPRPASLADNDGDELQWSRLRGAPGNSQR
jgi:hypothetical protein